MVSFIFLDHENGCGFGVKFRLHSLSSVHPWMAAGFSECPALESTQSLSQAFVKAVPREPLPPSRTREIGFGRHLL